MKLNLPDVTNSNSVSVINSNFAAIEQELQNKVLYRDNPSGEPNTLETALDANGKEIYNAGTLRTTNLYIDGERVIPSGVVVVEGETDISGLLVKTANLSDVQSAATSRINLGLGNVDNTSDLNKPISTNTASALAGKQDTLVSGVNIKTINSNSLLGTGDLVLTGVGETNTTSNLGGGQGLAAPKSGTNLPFKSLVAGTNVTMSSTANDVTINATVDTSTLLVKSNNLSDVQSTATSRTNLGLGNVDNTSDANKPISIATASSIATKQNTLVSGSNIKTVGGVSLLGSGNVPLVPSATDVVTALETGANTGVVAINTTAPNPFSSSFLIERTASYTGGTFGYVNSALFVDAIVNPGTTSFEWALTARVQNNSAFGENVGGYLQGNKLSTGTTWGGVSEVCDLTNTATNGSNGSSVGLEVDVWCNGSDNFASRIGIDVVVGNAQFIRGFGNGIGKGFAHAGLRISPMNNDPTKGEFNYGIIVSSGLNASFFSNCLGNFGMQLAGTYTVGIDLSMGTNNTAAIRLKANDYIDLEATSQIRMKYNPSTGFIEFYNGVSRMGYINMSGVDHAL